jgi:hypothetical protein
MLLLRPHVMYRAPDGAGEHDRLAAALFAASALPTDHAVAANSQVFSARGAPEVWWIHLLSNHHPPPTLTLRT